MSWINGEFIVQLLVAVGASGAIAQGITSFRERRKISAEAGDLIQQAAGRQVERLEREINDLRTQIKEDGIKFRAMLAEEQGKNEAFRQDALAHRAWEDRVVLEAQRRGHPIEPPPAWTF